ncbi:serine/threonine-protein kinase [Paractinoplanes deccanensis]|uniref:serine/threonine-protein kinase n=1 Tax=Paractinoplanes deccanensis TaxID=113561 RepID=UPI001EF24174|nr:serine/threonine-protein kinase [Actinoplanes deccanensis]
MVAGVHLNNRYRMSRLPLAHQGMGEVWQARDTVLNREVIVKLISSSMMDAELAKRFQREALLTAGLVHPGVPAVYDFGQHEGRFYLVLQKIEGVALSDLVEEHHPLPVAWVAAIGAQISSVLIAARRIRLIHRDIKPGNAMLEPNGAVKVLDFGLAAVHGDERYSRITQSGDSLGTLGYMAPEQIEGSRTDHRTDLYGLGATLFHLLTGNPPFDGPTTTITVQRQMQDSPPRPADLRPEIPNVVDDLVHALMARRPQDRPASAAEVYAMLAPLARNLPPIPGAVSNQPDAVRAYAAVVGQVPLREEHGTWDGADPDVDARNAGEHAEKLAAAGNFRAAAKEWRRLANDRAVQHGDEDLVVVDYRLRAIRIHAELGEHSRALRQLHALLQSGNGIDDPEHPAASAIRREIARLSGGARE